MKLTEKFREATAVVTTALALHGCGANGSNVSVADPQAAIAIDTRSDLGRALGTLGATREGVQKAPKGDNPDRIYSLACNTSALPDAASDFAREEAKKAFVRYGCPQDETARTIGFNVQREARFGLTTCVKATMPTKGIISCHGKPVDMKIPE